MRARRWGSNNETEKECHPMPDINQTSTMQPDYYFGACPHCEQTDGYVNAGRDHWYICKEHRVMWWVGSNLFSGWRDETEEEQRRVWNENGIGHFTVIEPVYFSQC